ncbi:cysteine proteinase [Neoconidiobolus thromboides FSU 785]|nr:cysteine proteinase [Neoconidiobolus thromboides FSU 785]
MGTKTHEMDLNKMKVNQSSINSNNKNKLKPQLSINKKCHKKIRNKVTIQYNNFWDFYNSPETIAKDKFNLVKLQHLKQTDLNLKDTSILSTILQNNAFGTLDYQYYYKSSEIPDLFNKVEIPRDFNLLLEKSRMGKLDTCPTPYRSLSTLIGNTWLNDDVINRYLELIVENSEKQESKQLTIHRFTTYFFTTLVEQGYKKVARWTRKTDIFKKDILLIPINLNNAHWACAIVHFKRKRIEYYDSIPSTNSKNHVVGILKSYLNEECMDKKKIPFNFDEWTDYTPNLIPQQMNGTDCGVFLLSFATCLIHPKFQKNREIQFPFNQNDIQYIRKRILYELLTEKLLN